MYAGGTSVFAVEELRQIMESMKKIVTGQGLEEKGGETARGSSGRTGRSGEVQRSDDTRQQFDRRKLEWKGDSGTESIGQKGTNQEGRLPLCNLSCCTSYQEGHES